MNTPTLAAVTSEHGRGKDTTPTLAIIVGTAFLYLAEYLPLLPDKSIVIAVDVPGELAKLRVRLVDGRLLQTVSLGAGQTARQLIRQYGSPAQVACLPLISSTSADGGMSQLSGFGEAAAHRLVASSGFARFVEHDVVPMLNAMAEGSLAKINLHMYQGASGGAGSEGGCVLHDEFVSVMLEQTDAIIDCRCHLLGAASFNSPGFPRTKYNAAGSIARWATRALYPPSDRVTTTLYCHELNPVGSNKPLRDGLLAEQHQALGATQVMEHLERVHSNYSVSGPLGNSRFIRTDHFQALPSDRIAADVAQGYLPAIIDVATSRPDTELVDEFHWEVQETPLPQESVESILERTPNTPKEELLDSLTASPAARESIPVISLRDGRQLPLQDVKATFGSPMVTITELAERIQMLRTCLVTTSEIREEVEDELDDLYGVQEKLVKQASKAIRAIQNVSIWSQMRGNATKIRRAKKAFDQLRKNSDQVWELASKQHGIASAQDQLENELTSLLGKLDRMKRLLQDVLPQGDKRRLTECVKPAPIDELLPELLKMAETPRISTTQTVHLLAQGVMYVTPAGLAHITGAADHTIEAIVRAACANPFVLEGPAWGGLPRQHGQADRFLVYPPVDPALAANIALTHDAAEGGHRVAFAQSALWSVNVVQLDVTYGKTTADLINKSYLRGLRQALASPLAPLYLDNADELLAELGITEEDLAADGNGEA